MRSEEEEERFRKRRAAHYNEFQVLRAWKQSGDGDDEIFTPENGDEHQANGNGTLFARDSDGHSVDDSGDMDFDQDTEN
jgi:hypothetical protein